MSQCNTHDWISFGTQWGHCSSLRHSLPFLNCLAGLVIRTNSSAEVGCKPTVASHWSLVRPFFTMTAKPCKWAHQTFASICVWWYSLHSIDLWHAAAYVTWTSLPRLYTNSKAHSCVLCTISQSSVEMHVYVEHTSSAYQIRQQYVIILPV